jgi:hypothetical protein
VSRGEVRRGVAEGEAGGRVGGVGGQCSAGLGCRRRRGDLLCMLR